jgi:hypothetical protein
MQVPSLLRLLRLEGQQRCPRQVRCAGGHGADAECGDHIGVPETAGQPELALGLLLL